MVAALGAPTLSAWRMSASPRGVASGVAACGFVIVRASVEFSLLGAVSFLFLVDTPSYPLFGPERYSEIQ